MSRSKQLSRLSTSEFGFRQIHAHAPQSSNRSTSSDRPPGSHRRISRGTTTDGPFRFQPVKAVCHSSPPTTRHQSDEQYAAGSRRFAGTILVHLGIVERPLPIFLVILEAGVARMICHATQFPLLLEFERPLTLSAGARNVVRCALVKQDAHHIPRVARRLLKRTRSRRQYVSSVRKLAMKLARSILMTARTRPENRSAEAPNINVTVAATFAETNVIVGACKQQRAITRSAQTVSF